jgi:hypothetical protein
MRIVERADEFDDPELDNYYWWDLYITVGQRTYYARRYKDEVETVTFHEFSDPRVDAKDRRQPFWPNQPDGDRREPFRGGVIPYDDTLFQVAVREVLTLRGVSHVEVFTSNESGRPAPVDLRRLLGKN